MGALALAGCTQLPDVTPFATATADMAAAVRSAGPAVASEVARMEGGGATAGRLAESWAARDAAMVAVVMYSDSLVSIVNAAHDRGNAIGALAEKLGGLASAAGFALPGSSAAVGVVTDAARFVWAQIELARGARTLEDALTAAQPAVDRIAEKLGDDFRDLDLALRAAVESQRGVLESDPGYNIPAGTCGTLVERKLALLEELADRGVDGNPELTDEDLSRVDRLDALMATTAAQLAATDESLGELEARARVVQDLVLASGGAVERWAVAHRDLANAVRMRRPINIDSLTAAAVEIRELIKRVREL